MMKTIAILLFALSKLAAFGNETNTSLPTPTVQHIITTPTNFIHQIASADHILIKPRGNDPMFKSLNITLSGKKTEAVVRAISLLKNDDVVGILRSRCDCEDMILEFYHGTNFLAGAFFVEEVVDINGEYKDETGTLEKLHDRLQEKMDKILENWDEERLRTNYLR